MAYSEDERRFIGGIFCLFNDNLTCLESWGFYLFNKEFKDEAELRNRLAVIWLASLFDSLHAEVRQLAKYRKGAEKHGLTHLSRYCDQAEYFFGSVKEIMNRYSKSEQIFVVYLRNQWVHSFLSGRHKEKVGIKFVEKNELKEESVTRQQHDEIVRPHFEIAPLDKTLQELVDRFRDRSLEYWTIVGELQQTRDIFYKAMLSGNEFEFRSIPV